MKKYYFIICLKQKKNGQIVSLKKNEKLLPSFVKKNFFFLDKYT